MAWKQPPRKPTSLTTKLNAHRLRRSMTDSEKQLWKHLRGEFAGSSTHFRRQVPIGSYVADFCCLKHRLIIELDGPIHQTSSARAYDAVRERTLCAGGYRIVRFSNSEISLNIKTVLDRIASALVASTPTPGPSPHGGGEYAPAPR